MECRVDMRDQDLLFKFMKIDEGFMSIIYVKYTYIEFYINV